MTHKRFLNPYNDSPRQFIDLGRYVHSEKNCQIDTYDLYALTGNPSGAIDLGARYSDVSSEYLSGIIEPSGTVYADLVLQECARRYKNWVSVRDSWGPSA